MEPRRSDRINASKRAGDHPDRDSNKKQSVLNEEAERWRDAARQAEEEVKASNASVNKLREDMETLVRQNNEFKEDLRRAEELSRDQAEIKQQYDFMKDVTLPGLIKDMEDMKRKFADAQKTAEDAQTAAQEADIRATEAEIRATEADIRAAGGDPEPAEINEYEKLLAAALAKKKALEQGIHLVGLEAKNVILQKQFDASLECLKNVGEVSVKDMAEVMQENLRGSVTTAFAEVVPEDKAVYQSTLEGLMKQLKDSRVG